MPSESAIAIRSLLPTETNLIEIGAFLPALEGSCNNPDHAHHLLEGLWLHQQHNVRNPQLLAALLESPQPHARVAAQTVQHYYYHVNAKADAMIAKKDGGSHEGHSTAKSGVVSQSSDVTKVNIGTVVEKMRYDVTEFTVKAGAKLEITFSNPDFMPHNLVFVKPGTADKVGMAAMQLGAKGFEMQFVPESADILIASKIWHRAEQAFVLPAKPVVRSDRIDRMLAAAAMLCRIFDR